MLLLTLRQGRALAKTPAGPLALQEGGSYRLSQGRLEACAAPRWILQRAWIPLQAPASIRNATRALLAEPAREYVLEVFVRKRSTDAELGLLFPAAGRAWQIPAGNNVLPSDEAWHRLRISRDSERCRITLGERVLLDRPLGDVGLEALPASGPGVSLRAWGGEIELGSARWRSLR